MHFLIFHHESVKKPIFGIDKDKPYFLVKLSLMKHLLLVLCFLVVGSVSSNAQRLLPEAIQFSGLVVTGSVDNIIPVPYSTIAVKGTPRGTYANYAGFYSLVVRPGEVLIFTAIGFKKEEYTVPDTIVGNKFNYVQHLQEDTILLPEAVVYPWPSNTYLKQEFLAMDVTDDLQVRIQENLMAETLENLRVALVRDAKENARFALRQETDKLYYQGQLPPNYMSIFNPTAWIKFFQAIKNGDFKKK